MKSRSKAARVIFLVFLAPMCLLSSSTLFAQPKSGEEISQKLKVYLNDVVREVEATDKAEGKRVLLNESFNRLVRLMENVKEQEGLSEQDLRAATALESAVREKQDELNGWNGFEAVGDMELDDFADYSLQSLEQALDRVITISLGTAILIGLLLLLI